jgi:multimeric flavodoxin WrbA
LKRSPSVSNTEGLARKVIEWFDTMDVDSELVRVVDYHIPTGTRYPLYNKVAGVVVTGNEDGAHSAAETTLFNMTHLGCTVPPNADTYWVGDAGPGPSYLDAGQEHPYTQRTTRWLAHNLVHMARMLKANPIPPEGNTFEAEEEPTRHAG